MSLSPRSFLALNILISQSGRYCTLLRVIVCTSLLSVAQRIVLLLCPRGLASPLAVVITGKFTGVYVPESKSSIDCEKWQLAPVSNRVPSSTIDQL
jgi:hypothetical protein